MKVEVKMRLSDENCQFSDNIETAIDKIEQAISNINYLSYPEINRELIKKLQSICTELDDALDMRIYKPV